MNVNMNRRLSSAIIVVALVVLGAAFVFWLRNAEKSVSPKEIVLGVDFSDVFSTPVLIAEDQGYFRDEAKIPDYRHFISTNILESVKPEAVNIIR